jgi:hypothetical protein
MFTYSQLEEIWNTRRKGNEHKPLTRHGLRNCDLEKRGNDFAIYFHRNLIVIVQPDNMMTLHSHAWYDSPTTRERIWCISRVSVTSDRKTTGLETTTRLNGLPLTNGMKFRNGVCLNPEICVDIIHTLPRSAVTEVSMRIAKLKAIAASMARIAALERMDGRKDFGSINFEDPQYADACTVYRAGWEHLDYYKRENQLTCLQAGFKRVRQWLYDDLNMRVAKEIRHGHDQRIAA